MKTDCLKGIDTLRYSDIFLAMYSDNGSSCLHRNHSHVLVYMYSGELEIKEHKKITRLHKGDCAFIRKDFSVQLTKQARKMEQFKAVFLMFTDKFLRNFYCRLDKESLPENARRSKVSLYRLPSDRPDIVSLFESMTPYFNSGIRPTDELLELKMTEGLYVLLNTDKNLYASLFDFAEPLKIDDSKFSPDQCVFDEDGIYWSFIRFEGDTAVIHGCGELYRFARPAIDDPDQTEWIAFEKY